MISITLDLGGTPEELAAIAGRLDDLTGAHNAMATAAESALKDFGRNTTQEHRTATRLGAAPTGHLTKAYQQVEGQSDRASARLLIPRASRLRAAFGKYTVRPGPGKTYLTIPVAAEAYGKRAREIDGLVPMRVGPRKTPILARPNADGGITTYYLLATKADIKEDTGLIPFDDLTATARDAAEIYILSGNLFTP